MSRVCIHTLNIHKTLRRKEFFHPESGRTRLQLPDILHYLSVTKNAERHYPVPPCAAPYLRCGASEMEEYRLFHKETPEGTT